MNKLLIITSVCIFLSGCLVGPNYRPPETLIPDNWSSEEASTSSLTSCVDPPENWWQVFNDPLLNKYIEMATICNNEVLAAQANIWQARALKQVAAADLFPHIWTDLSAARAYFSKNGPFFSFTPGPFQAQIPRALNLYNFLIDASWEIDIFGKKRRGVEAAEANIGSAIEERNAILISVFAEIAINYMELRSNQKKGVLTEEYIYLLEKNASLVTRQFEVGYRDRLDLDRIQAELAQSIATLPDLYAQIYQNIYALSILTGNLPEALVAELLLIQPLPPLLQEITVGIRSDLLRRRPDVRKAERQLAAATANVGVAVASFFPTFPLVGGIGFESLQLYNLFHAKSLTSVLAGDIHIPIFQGGKLVGNLRANEAATAAAAFNYQKTVLNALREAESGLIAYSEKLETSKQLKEVVHKYASIVFLTNEKYAKGLIDLIDLLDSERQWNTSLQNLLTSETSALIDLIKLYKALGGGWEFPLTGEYL